MTPLYANPIKGNLSSKTMGEGRVIVKNLVTLYLSLCVGLILAGLALYNNDIYMCLSPYILCKSNTTYKNFMALWP